MKRFHIHPALLLLIITPSIIPASRTPRVTVIMVVDQFGQHYIQKLRSHFRYGLRHLLHHGIVYENAYYPHSVPSTGPGHAGLNTGAYPKDHGIVGNRWFDMHGNRIPCDLDCAEKAAVFSPDGLYDEGRSSHFLMVDGITDQFMLHKDTCDERHAYSLSIKSRAATMTAGKLGKAVWFDHHTGNFTSSKAYFDELPEWIKDFNDQASFKHEKTVTWCLARPRKSRAYCYKNIDNYKYSSRPEPLAGKTLAMSSKLDKDPYELFLRTPHANKLLFDLAAACIDEHVTYYGGEELFLWVCLSPLDMIGHEYGPQSLEVIDMIYHLDWQIADFMKTISKRLKRHDFLFVLTADHGVTQIPELMKEEGYTTARRITYHEILDELNALVKKHYNIDNLVLECHTSQFYLNHDILDAFPHEIQQDILRLLKKHLQRKHIFKKVWTEHELTKLACDPDSHESFYKHHLFHGRSGSLIVQPHPYQPIISYHLGTTHRTPYESDTHVPLILYQKGYIEKHTVYDHVWALQLPSTLAQILNIPKPSSTSFNMLPGIIDYDPVTGEAIQPVVL